MKTSQAGIDAIKAHEGLVLKAYRDIAGVLTIGYGHTRGVEEGQTITSSAADFLLRQDVELCEAAVNNVIRVPLTQGQFDACVSFVFNLGAQAFKDSTLLQKLNAGDYAGAADEFTRWNKARVGGELKPVAGLTARRAAERAMFLGGTQHQHVDAPRPDQEPYVAPAATPAPKEPSVVAPVVAIAGSFLWELAKGVISSFTPLAAEKLTKEISRHTSKPEVAGQIVTGVIEAVKTATGKADPLEAVVAFKTAPPSIVAKAEADSLAHLDKLMPVLERLQTWEQASWTAEEASRNAATERALAEENDQDEFLTRSIVWLLAGVLVGGSILAVVLAMYKVDVQTIVGALILLVGTVGGKFGTRYDHRYGSSRGSAAAGAALREIASRPKDA